MQSRESVIILLICRPSFTPMQMTIADDGGYTFTTTPEAAQERSPSYARHIDHCSPPSKSQRTSRRCFGESVKIAIVIWSGWVLWIKGSIDFRFVFEGVSIHFTLCGLKCRLRCPGSTSQSVCDPWVYHKRPPDLRLRTADQHG